MVIKHVPGTHGFDAAANTKSSPAPLHGSVGVPLNSRRRSACNKWTCVQNIYTFHTSPDNNVLYKVICVLSHVQG
ncbi:hypothetical protein 11 [Diadegma semiclausum ichnovirus]|nr:hypothetical protein 11 [Diadegma semiclausum ichnovirus]